VSLYTQTKALWGPECVALSGRWATALCAGMPWAEAAGDTFREWRPLRFYLALGDAARRAGRQPSVRFSVRFCGQEVANLRVGSTPVLEVGLRHRQATAKYFQMAAECGAWPWDSPQARVFRAKFRALGQDDAEPPAGHSEEHAIESRIILEMEKTAAATKFAGTLAGIRHVGLTRHAYPFQCPTPLSASSGAPKKTTGHIDILARRRGADGKVRLSVWELKRPGQLQHALDQAYVYALTLALMLRAEGGDDWYRIFGFTPPVPGQLEIEAVVAVTEDQRTRLARAAQALGAANELVLAAEGVRLSLHAAYYEPRSLAIKFENLAP